MCSGNATVPASQASISSPRASKCAASRSSPPTMSAARSTVRASRGDMDYPPRTTPCSRSRGRSIVNSHTRSLVKSVVPKGLTPRRSHRWRAEQLIHLLLEQRFARRGCWSPSLRSLDADVYETCGHIVAIEQVNCHECRIDTTKNAPLTTTETSVRNCRRSADNGIGFARPLPKAMATNLNVSSAEQRIVHTDEDCYEVMYWSIKFSVSIERVN